VEADDGARSQGRGSVKLRTEQVQKTALQREKSSTQLGLSICLVLAVAFAVNSARAENGEPALRVRYEGRLYAVGSKLQDLIFHWTLAASQDEEWWRTEFRAPGGELVTSESIRFDGGAFREYHVVQHTAQREGRALRHGDQIEFSYTVDGKTKTHSEPYHAAFTAGPMIISFIQEHWEPLLAGEKFDVYLAAPDRLSSVKFRAALEERGQWREQPAVTIRVKPASRLVASVVAPLDFTLSPDGRTVYQMVGRTAALRREGGRWKPVRVHGVYSTVEE